jgi:hypothetical protein
MVAGVVDFGARENYVMSVMTHFQLKLGLADTGWNVSLRVVPCPFVRTNRN